MEDLESTYESEKAMKNPRFAIRYVRLHFCIEYTEDCQVPKYKASALRGGMGEMLLRANCIRERQCEQCDFETECIVPRTMYSKMEIQPAFMSKGDSVGYVIECEDYHDTFAAGDNMHFQMILFGKTIVYFSQFLNAFYALGQQGYGKYNAKYFIQSVMNTTGQPILSGNDIHMENYQVKIVADYVDYRMKQVKKSFNGNLLLKFHSPLSIRIHGKVLKEFQTEAIISALKRRIYILDCFEGIAAEQMELEAELPEELMQETRIARVKRYSNRKQEKMELHGVEGTLDLTQVEEEWLPLFLAGELIHIGKYTSFGFGRYRVLVQKENDK